MKLVAITGQRECALVERPMPRISGSFATIKIHSAPMCTEVQGYRDGRTSENIGHEAAGEVVEIAQPGKVRVGQRVVVMPHFGCGLCALCQAGDHIHCENLIDPHAVNQSETGRATYAQYCIKQDWLLLPIPDHLPYDYASMACCGLGPTFNAMQRMQVDALDTVLVSGLGAVGLGAVVNARVRGARVIGLEINPYRAELAQKLGAEAVIDPRDPDAVTQILALTGGHGADKSIETSSTEQGPGLLVQATRRRGQICSVGWGGPMLARDLVAKGLSVHGIWHWNHQRDAERMFRTIDLARPLLDMMITHTFPISRVKDAWELQLTGQCGKVILHPWEEA